MEEFRRLYEENYRMVLFYLKHLCKDDKLAEDLTQDTFYHVLFHLCSGKKLDVNRKWFIKVAHNVFLDHLRKSKVTPESLEIHADTLESRSGAVTADSANRLDLFAALGKLPVRYKSLILLKDHYGFSYREIAEITGSTEASVKVSIFRARSKFKEVYKAYE